MRIISQISVLTLAALMTFVSPAAAAQGPSYLQEAVQALQSGDSYVSRQVSNVNPNIIAELTDEVAGNDVAVIVLPAAAAAETNGDVSAFVVQVARESGRDTVLVSIGGDLDAGSRVLPAGEAALIANRAEVQNISTQDALRDAIIELSESSPITEQRQPPDVVSEPGLPWGAILAGGAVALVVLVVCFRPIIRRLVRLRYSSGEERIAEPGETAEMTSRRLTQPIHDRLEQIRAHRGLLTDKALAHSLEESEKHTLHLFSILQRRDSKILKDAVQTYGAYLTELEGMLRRYVLDIQTSQAYLTDTQYADVKEIVDGAAHAYEEGVRSIISQVVLGGNRASIESSAALIQFMQKPANEWQKQFDRAVAAGKDESV